MIVEGVPVGFLKVLLIQCQGVLLDIYDGIERAVGIDGLRFGFGVVPVNSVGVEFVFVAAWSQFFGFAE